MKTRLLIILAIIGIVSILLSIETSHATICATESLQPGEKCPEPKGVLVHPSPYAQQEDGVEPEQVRCNHDLYRNYKTSNGNAFCASGYTIRELVHRGYAEPFDGLVSATASGPNNIVNEYCPASQELLQWGWYGYKNPTDIVVTNIDLVYSAEEDSNGVEFTFEKSTEGQSMLWVFVECDDHFDTFEVIILPSKLSLNILDSH